ncbi:MAG: polysaccharide biosynthesis C-terminal domain-containing protein [Bacteroidales bacterium]
MINFKEHFKLTAVYTFFAAFPALLQLIVYPVIEGETRLGAEDFGYLAITEVIISLVFTFSIFGTANGLARLYYDNKDNHESYNKLVSTVLSGIISRGLLLTGISILFAPLIGSIFNQPALQNFEEYGPYAVISGLNRAVIFMAVVLYRHEKKLSYFVIVSLLSGLFRSGFQIAGVLFYDLSFKGYVYGTALGGGIVALGIILFIYFTSGLHYNKTINAELYPFSRPLFFSELIFWGFLFADRFFLLGNPEQLGIYDNAVKFAMGIQLVIQGLSAGVQPEIFRFLKDGIEKKHTEIKKLSSLLLAESLIIIALAIIPVMLFIDFFYETSLQLSAAIISILFIRYIFRVQYVVFSWPLMFSKKTIWFFVLNSVALFINLLINWFLTPKIGYYGAIIAFLVSSFVQVLLIFTIQQKVIPIQWNYKKMIYFPIGIIAFTGSLEFLKHAYNISAYLTSSLVILFIFSGLALVYKNEIKGVIKILQNKFTGKNTNNMKSITNDEPGQIH